MLRFRCAGWRLNDSFRGIQLLERFIQDHSDAWMIHSGPFSCLNDSFRLFQKKTDIFSTTNSKYSEYCSRTSVRGTLVANSRYLKNRSGAFSWLNDSFMTIQMLEWFIQDHSVAWMIHSDDIWKRLIPNVMNLKHRGITNDIINCPSTRVIIRLFEKFLLPLANFVRCAHSRYKKSRPIRVQKIKNPIPYKLYR